LTSADARQHGGSAALSARRLRRLVSISAVSFPATGRSLCSFIASLLLASWFSDRMVETLSTIC
jgi:hypothetical protein